MAMRRRSGVAVAPPSPPSSDALKAGLDHFCNFGETVAVCSWNNAVAAPLEQ